MFHNAAHNSLHYILHIYTETVYMNFINNNAASGHMHNATYYNVTGHATTNRPHGEETHKTASCPC